MSYRMLHLMLILFVAALSAAPASARDDDNWGWYSLLDQYRLETDTSNREDAYRCPDEQYPDYGRYDKRADDAWVSQGDWEYQGDWTTAGFRDRQYDATNDAGAGGTHYWTADWYDPDDQFTRWYDEEVSWF